MLNFLFGNTRSNEVTDSLLREKRMAEKLFERAMRNHGVNSDEANHWSAKIDEAEAALAA
jgi:hypothetical protein